MDGVVIGLHVNPNGGVPKHPVESIVVHSEGCVGDKQNDRKHHGGPLRAVCLLERRVMEILQSAGHPIHPGSTGENILLDGLGEGSMTIGSTLAVGRVVLLITGDAPPCKTIQASFTDGSFKQLSHKQTLGQTRWYASVIQQGTVHLGDKVRLLSEDEPAGNR
ncbi:MAG: sulfurase [Euryarchaeota archaeon]|nr:sulfurase [Euryarchaeota archaeon]MAV78244.1 sulfurase [Euryarchaeota archaeon]